MSREHTIVAVGAAVAQANLTITLDGVDGSTDASVVISSASGVLLDGSGDTRRSTSRHIFGNADSTSDSGESRKGENAKGSHNILLSYVIPLGNE